VLAILEVYIEADLHFPINSFQDKIKKGLMQVDFIN